MSPLGPAWLLAPAVGWAGPDVDLQGLATIATPRLQRRPAPSMDISTGSHSAVLPAVLAAAAAASSASVASSQARLSGRRARSFGQSSRSSPSRVVRRVNPVTGEKYLRDVDYVEVVAAEPRFGTDDPLGLVPPPEIRARIKQAPSLLGKATLAYIGDAVWEYLVLRHQNKQVVKSPFTDGVVNRAYKQGKIASRFFKGKLLEGREKLVLSWGTSGAGYKGREFHDETIQRIGHEAYNASRGLCTLLGYLYIDAASDDSRLEHVIREIGLLATDLEEDQLLQELTDGMFDPAARPKTKFFLALEPLGYVALRLYVMRYLVQRPCQASEYIFRVKYALRDEELNTAAASFFRDDATDEERALMTAARDREDTFKFAWLCLLGDHALNKPYRLHQIIANFGWCAPLPEEGDLSLLPQPGLPARNQGY